MNSISLTSNQKSRLATLTSKAHKDKKAATPKLIDPGSVQILGEVSASLQQIVAIEKRKATHTKESSKKNFSKSSTDT